MSLPLFEHPLDFTVVSTAPLSEELAPLRFIFDALNFQLFVGQVVKRKRDTGCGAGHR